MGYPFGHKGWKLYDLKIHEFFCKLNVVFHGHFFPFMKIEEEEHEDLSIFLSSKHIVDADFGGSSERRSAPSLAEGYDSQAQ